ncbi:ATP-grasp domain-containing protein [Hartmannibacter diazotrophicus]|uniref:ATP-grasp domain-containing protein n=1 Tax=Hartmannibacter diazotrophicus TaxID=1482074 RepID=UPI0012FD3270|nr:ATP-grasp domain-containing protein [Hartmannibacter diazotrophicus]
MRDLIEAAPDKPVGLVAGSGFEDRPQLLEALAALIPILGNGTKVVSAVKDPAGLAARCRDLGIPHPETRTEPALSGEWLLKRKGGSGGSHIRAYSLGESVPAGHVLAQTLPGTPMSVTAIGNGRDAALVGFCRQFADPVEGQPFRFGGLCGPVDLPQAIAVGVGKATKGLAAAFGLKGFFSMDFLLEGESWWCLEVNPRPGASLDVLDQASSPLFAAHVDACVNGRLPDERRVAPAAIRYSRIVYADKEIAGIPALEWPEWVSDRPSAGSRIPAGAPLATVLAEGKELDDAAALAMARAQELLKIIGEVEQC